MHAVPQTGVLPLSTASKFALTHSLGVSNKDRGWKGRLLENLAARAGHNLAGVTGS